MWWKQQLQYLTLSEISGALGDLGTFLPLLIGLVVQTGLDFGTTLIGTGLYNILTGIQFGIPMPVQPMKTISAVALSESSLTVTQICLAGIMVSGVVFFLGVTRLIVTITKHIPMSLVRGIQLGLGLNLAKKGFMMALQEKNGDWANAETIMMGSLTIIFILITIMPPKDDTPQTPPQPGSPKPPKAKDTKKGGFPAALIVVIFGLIYTLVTHKSETKKLQFGPSTPDIIFPISWEDVRVAAVRAALPQLPLTLLNSVVSVCKLSEDLFPEQPAGTAAVSVSVGLMNLVGGWLGVMPSCHGAGGLAAQVRFGAQSGVAVIFLGTVKVILGLLFGSSFFSLFHFFPRSVLGAMLLFSGIELASTAKDQRGSRNWLLVLITAAGCLAKNTAVGFLAGIVAYILTIVVDTVKQKFARRSFRITEDFESLESQDHISSSPSSSSENKIDDSNTCI